MVHKVSRALAHATAQATGAEAPAFAVALAATLTMHLREAIGEDAAAQEPLQFPGHELRKAPAEFGVRPHPFEGGQLPLEDLVERGLL